MGGCLGLLLAPLGFFVSHPYLAFVPAALFLVYYFLRRSAAAELDVPGQVRWSLIAGLVWIAYAIYEMAMDQWSRSIAGAPIRVDLFLVFPVIYLLTAAAIWGCVAFEISAAKGPPLPVKPFTPGPYARTRNRPFVIGLAIALASFPLLNLVFRLSVLGSREIQSPVVAFLVVLALSFFLVQGRQWAKWCLVLWFAYETLFDFVGWSSLRMARRPDMEIYRYWHLVTLVVDVVLGAYLLFSRRLKEHLAAHS